MRITNLRHKTEVDPGMSTTEGTIEEEPSEGMIEGMGEVATHLHGEGNPLAKMKIPLKKSLLCLLKKSKL